MTYRKFLKVLARVVCFAASVFAVLAIFNFVFGRTESLVGLTVKSVVAAVVFTALRSWEKNHLGI